MLSRIDWGGGVYPSLIFLWFFLCIKAKKELDFLLDFCIKTKVEKVLCQTFLQESLWLLVLLASQKNLIFCLTFVSRQKSNVWIKGVACCFSLVKLSLCNSKRKLMVFLPFG